MAGYWIVAPRVPLIEPSAVAEIVVNGPGGFWYDNGMLMMPCYREETPIEAPDAPPQRVVKIKIMWSNPDIKEAIDMLEQCRFPVIEPPADKLPPFDNVVFLR